ncbi:hypothetical protein [Pararhodobacter aggregans]|uniref:DUF2497 domain-containing protein n=1 Tax=Pararhodobacter aggregans TaxID=404875 RepID=A0A2T7UUU7_9RHOB|nr:hypothetical protein [Pararhodobacter aggregans]PTX04187.1 hypothetical protein C8N33_102468 [Pararhodobacter aggregans]PVE48361.1 hypothetical protein DDE23_04625 [Pararhodobacter aggregans]
MSDAMTNREIEDVLTSIRRLVAQEGGRGAEAGRLILTEAQRVNAAPEAEAEQDADAAQVAIPAPDFGKLEATIAELEAAFATSEFEGDNAADSEAPRASNVTELYGRLSFAHRGKEAEVATQAEPATAAATVAVADPPASVEPAPEAPAMTDAPAAEPAADLADYLHAAANDDAALPGEDEAFLDEETLRLLVAQIVREELKGQLGERITQQVRKLVRAEIAKALDERSYL